MLMLVNNVVRVFVSLDANLNFYLSNMNNNICRNGLYVIAESL